MSTLTLTPEWDKAFPKADFTDFYKDLFAFDGIAFFLF